MSASARPPPMRSSRSSGNQILATAPPQAFSSRPPLPQAPSLTLPPRSSLSSKTPTLEEPQPPPSPPRARSLLRPRSQSGVAAREQRQRLRARSYTAALLRISRSPPPPSPLPTPRFRSP